MATRERRATTTADPLPPEPTISVPIDLRDLTEDIGYLTLKPDAMTRGLVTLYQRATGAPRGRLEPEEEQQAMEEVVRLRATFAPLVDRVLRDMDQYVNEWFRGLLWMDLILGLMTREHRLAHLEKLDAKDLPARLALPTVREDLKRVRERGPGDERQRWQTLLSRVPVRRGRPPLSAEKSSAAKIAEEVEEAKLWLKPGFEFWQQRKKARDYLSSDFLVKDELVQRMGYVDLEALAITSARYLPGAAINYVALVRDLRANSVKVIASRGRKELRQRAAHPSR